MAYPCIAWVFVEGRRGVKAIAGEETQSGREYAGIVLEMTVNSETRIRRPSLSSARQCVAAAVGCRKPLNDATGLTPFLASHL